MARTQEERTESTRAAICGAMVDLLREVDYDRIATKQLAERASVSRSTFYRYYSSPADVLDELEDGVIASIEDINRVAVTARLRSSSTQASPTLLMRLEALYANREAVLSLGGPHGRPGFSDRVGKVIGAYFSQKMDMLGLSQAEQALCMSFIIGGHHRFIRDWLMRHRDMQPVQAATLLNQLFYAPLLGLAHQEKETPGRFSE